MASKTSSSSTVKKSSGVFKKLEIVNTSLVKSSVRRGIRQLVREQYPEEKLSNEQFDELFPLKCKLNVYKCKKNVQLIANENVPLFFNVRGGYFLPTLRVLHQFPTLLSPWQVDEGAIRFVLAGANIMAPGFTSEGGLKNEVRSVKNVKLNVGDPVAIYAEDRKHALAVGFALKSSDEIIEDPKGLAVENLHYISDELWMRQTLADE